jgi:hypothetical protein
MSNPGRHLRRARERQQKRTAPTPDAFALYDPDRMTVEEAAIVAARVEGCTCAPTVTIAGVSAFLQHDDWCALLRCKDVN